MFCLSFYSLERIDTLQNNLLVLIKPSVAGGFFYILQHGKEHQIFGIRAIIDYPKQELSRQSLYSKKELV
jgi:hypothetical protein